MLKIIWHKKDLESIQKHFYDEHQLVLTTESDNLPEDRIALIVEEKHFNLVKEILESLEHEKKQVVLQTQEGWLQVYVQHITYLESYGEEIHLHFEHQATEIVKQPLYQLEELLRPYLFVRIGKSYIVNLTKIKYIRTALNAKLNLELVSGDKLSVSRSFVKSFKNALGIHNKED